MTTDGPDAPYRDFLMPENLVGHARAWLEDSSGEPVVPKPSATVMLLRDTGQTAAALEVFVLRRTSTMPFAPGAVVFPGGGVDARDADPGVPWAGPTAQEWASTLHTDEVAARELVIAAAREVFEECGVLLAGPDQDSVVADLTDPAWDRERDELLAREQSFGELLIRRRLVLRSDLLQARAHWITPEAEPRRYTTRFFAARMPEGQRADDRTSEAVRADWVTPQQALADFAAGRERMLPPTVQMLEHLTAAPSVEALLATPVPLWPVMPWPVEHSDQMWMRAPIDAAGHGIRPRTT
ncbi:NUDIX hydrolase [Ornithinicoccus hortensis]|uniref:Nudix hydrolase domain-containing protein n=1 Tax=Ornithinicoccus hortensis TaxID=82346 RepID=A0A542YW34_9MICO|nr:NUDIX domain-containing protein [Ornithinicoccus hortensis]TQL52291.1 hypothetical protein FB467_3471 [Ornithinicoccus hortensis]